MYMEDDRGLGVRMVDKAREALRRMVRG